MGKFFLEVIEDLRQRGHKTLSSGPLSYDDPRGRFRLASAGAWHQVFLQDLPNTTVTFLELQRQCILTVHLREVAPQTLVAKAAKEGEINFQSFKGWNAWKEATPLGGSTLREKTTYFRDEILNTLSTAVELIHAVIGSLHITLVLSTDSEEANIIDGIAAQLVQALGGAPQARAPQGIPQPGIPSSAPQQGIPQSGIPHSGIPQGVPQSGIPQAGIPQSRAPQSGIPSGIPQSGIPSSIPQQGIPHGNIPQGIPQAGIPRAGIPQQGIPQGIPQAGFPSAIPQGIPQGNIPQSGIPSFIPQGGIPSGVPSSAPQQGIPQSGIPHSGIPQGVPQSGIPRSGIPQSGIPSSIPPAGIPHGHMPQAGIPQQGIPQVGSPQQTAQYQAQIAPQVAEAELAVLSFLPLSSSCLIPADCQVVSMTRDSAVLASTFYQGLLVVLAGVQTEPSVVAANAARLLQERGYTLTAQNQLQQDASPAQRSWSAAVQGRDSYGAQLSGYLRILMGAHENYLAIAVLGSLAQRIEVLLRSVRLGRILPSVIATQELVGSWGALQMQPGGERAGYTFTADGRYRHQKAQAQGGSMLGAMWGALQSAADEGRYFVSHGSLVLVSPLGSRAISLRRDGQQATINNEVFVRTA